MDILAARWAEFGASEGSPDAADVVVFDGAFLQNTLVELVLFADRDADCDHRRPVSSRRVRGPLATAPAAPGPGRPRCGARGGGT